MCLRSGKASPAAPAGVETPPQSFASRNFLPSEEALRLRLGEASSAALAGEVEPLRSLAAPQGLAAAAKSGHA